MACYVQNRVLINKQQMKTPYEILYGYKPNVAHFRSFGCPCTLLHLEATPKFNSKADDCYFVGYAGHTAYRVYNKATKQIVESFDVRWLEENETDARVGPDWLFDYAELFKPFYAFLNDVSGTPSSSVFNRDEDDEVPAAPVSPSMTLIHGVSPQPEVQSGDLSDDQSGEASNLEKFPKIPPESTSQDNELPDVSPQAEVASP